MLNLLLLRRDLIFSSHLAVLSFLVSQDAEVSREEGSSIVDDLIRWGLVDPKNLRLDAKGVGVALRAIESADLNAVAAALPTGVPVKNLIRECLAHLPQDTLEKWRSILKQHLDAERGKSTSDPKNRPPFPKSTLRQVAEAIRDRATTPSDNYPALTDVHLQVPPSIHDGGTQVRVVWGVTRDLYPGGYDRPDSDEAKKFRAYELLLAGEEASAAELIGGSSLPAFKAWAKIKTGRVLRLSGSLVVYLGKKSIRVALFSAARDKTLLAVFADQFRSHFTQVPALEWPRPVKVAITPSPQQPAMANSGPTTQALKTFAASWSYAPEEPYGHDAEEILQFTSKVWAVISATLTAMEPAAVIPESSSAAFSKFLSTLGTTPRIFRTLGGKAQFSAWAEGTTLVIKNSGGITYRRGHHIFDAVADRFSRLDEQRKMHGSEYTHPKWAECGDMIVAPYIAAIMATLVSEQNLSVP